MKTKKDEKELEVIEQKTDVVVAPTTDLDSFYGQEDEQAEDVNIIPSLAIAQKHEHAGKLYSKDMDMAWDELTVAMLRVTNSRVLWPEDFNKDNAPLCRSHDGVVPACDIPEDQEADDKVFLPAMHDNCNDCDYSQWSKAGAPRCLDVRNLLLLDMETNIPFLYSVFSIGLSPYNKKLNKPITLRKMALTASRKREGLSPAHISMFQFKLSTELDVRPSGEAYKPVFSGLEELDDDLKVFTGQVAMSLANVADRSISDGAGGSDGEVGGGASGSEEESF